MEIPTLTEVIVEMPNPTKPEVAFYITFFNIEYKRQQLLSQYGYGITKIIEQNLEQNSEQNFNKYKVIYTFPVIQDKSISNILSLSMDNPFDDRIALFNQMDFLLMHFAKVKQIKKAQALLTQSLTPQQLEALRRLPNDVIVSAIKDN